MGKWLIAILLLCCSTQCFPDGNRMNMSDLPVALQKELASLGKDPVPWNMAIAYPWLAPGKLVMVRDGISGRRDMVYLDESGGYVFLNRKENYAQLARILDAPFADVLDNREKLRSFVYAISDLALAPRNFVGMQSDFEKIKQKKRLHEWLDNRIKDPAVFKNYCQDPKITRDKKTGVWRLSFYVFRPSGAVLQALISGSETPFHITSIAFDVVMDPYSFSFGAGLE